MTLFCVVIITNEYAFSREFHLVSILFRFFLNFYNSFLMQQKIYKKMLRELQNLMKIICILYK